MITYTIYAHVKACVWGFFWLLDLVPVSRSCRGLLITAFSVSLPLNKETFIMLPPFRASVGLCYYNLRQLWCSGGMFHEGRSALCFISWVECSSCTGHGCCTPSRADWSQGTLEGSFEESTGSSVRSGEETPLGTAQGFLPCVPRPPSRIPHHTSGPKQAHKVAAGRWH